MIRRPHAPPHLLTDKEPWNLQQEFYVLVELPTSKLGKGHFKGDTGWSRRILIERKNESLHV
jgi:hypothetical protein